MLEGIQGVSSYANEVDLSAWILHIITIFLFLTVVVTMFYFVWKYRANKHPKEKTKNITHNLPLELTWTIIPTILLMIVFYYGVEGLKAQRTMPSDDDSMVIKVTGFKWDWKFEYPDGKITNTNLTVPAGKNIKLEMSAPKNDVLHAFFVPAFRIKEDVIPGQTTKLWFKVDKPGAYDLLCAEYCGQRHSYMTGKIIVKNEVDYSAWLEEYKVKLASNANDDPIKKGKIILTNTGCLSCHSVDGSPLVAPSFKGIYEREVKIVNDNGDVKSIKSSKEYLIDSIINPNKEIVEGYSKGMMPSYEGVISEDKMKDLIEYLKTLK